MSKVYTTTVIEEGNDLLITFPDRMMQSLGWKENDILEWKIDGDVITLKKGVDPTEAIRKFEGQNEISGTK